MDGVRCELYNERVRGGGEEERKERIRCKSDKAMKVTGLLLSAITIIRLQKICHGLKMCILLVI